MQQAGMAAQTCLNDADVMTGVSIMFFFQGLGGSVFISIAQSVFTHGLVKYLGDLGGGVGITPAMIVNTGATDLRDLVPESMLGVVLVAYNKALSDTFKVALGCACASILAGLTMEWKSVKNKKRGGKEGEQEVVEKGSVVSGEEGNKSQEVAGEKKSEEEPPSGGRRK